MWKLYKYLRNLTLDDLKWLLEFGISKRPGSIFDLRYSNFNDLPDPVFFLSTGRAGTKWFSEIIRKDKRVKVLHNPYPNFAIQNKYVYDCLKGDPKHLEGLYNCIKELYLTGRENYLRYGFKTDRRLIETNSSITFFAPMLAKLFPGSRFIHLVRPPEEFVRSGLNRGYYSGHVQDIRRIIPYSLNEKDWLGFSQVEKVSWLWFETNRFIHEFGKSLSKDRFCVFPFKDLSSDRIMELLSFIEVNISESHVKRKILKPVNKQRKIMVDHLKETDLNTIRRICSNEVFEKV